MKPETGEATGAPDEGKRETFKRLLTILTLTAAGGVGALAVHNERTQLETDKDLLEAMGKLEKQIDLLTEADSTTIAIMTQLLKRIVDLEERVALLESGQPPQTEPPVPFGDPLEGQETQI
jgi:hypothetical protein